MKDEAPSGLEAMGGFKQNDLNFFVGIEYIDMKANLQMSESFCCGLGEGNCENLM